MVKHIQGWDISSKLQNKHKVCVRSFSSAKVKSMKDYSKPFIKEDKPDHLMLHVGTNDLASGNTAERIAKSIADLAKGLVVDDHTISVSSKVPRNNKLNGKAAEVNSCLESMCSNVNIPFVDNARVINSKKHLNKSKLHLNLKSSAKLRDLFINSIKKMYSIWSPHTKSRSSRDKGLTLIRNKLTDDKMDCGDSNENFKYYLSSLRRKNLNRVILAQVNINSMWNKFDLLAEGIKGKVDVLMISETKIDATFLSRQFYVEEFIPPYRLDWHSHGWGILVYVRENIPSKLIEMNSSVESISIELNLREKKWLVNCPYNANNSNICDHLRSLRKSLDTLLTNYDKVFLMGDFNAEELTFILRISVICIS